MRCDPRVRSSARLRGGRDRPRPGACAGAGGFALFEQGARSMGFAGAFTAQANDPSAIFHNAAGIAFLKGRQLYRGGRVLQPRTTFTGGDPFPGAGVTERTETTRLLPPAVFYTHQFSERLVLGAGLTRPFARHARSGTNPETFSGRFLAQRRSSTRTPSTPPWPTGWPTAWPWGSGSTSGCPPWRAPAVPRPASRDQRSGGRGLGAGRRPPGHRHWLQRGPARPASPRASPSARTTAAASTTTTRATPSSRCCPPAPRRWTPRWPRSSPRERVPVRTSIRFPAVINVGAAYEWGDWTFAGDVGFWQWSKFQQIALDFEGREDLREVVVQDYADSAQIRLGAERRLGATWAVRGGYLYDDSPAPAASLSPLLFDADRHGFTLGGSWRQGPWRVDAAGGVCVRVRAPRAAPAATTTRAPTRPAR